MVGFFDSGSGGLSVLTHFRKFAPKVDVIYFGDITNAPYGEKPAQELARLTTAGVNMLTAHGAEAIVSACNSVSPSILSGASEALPFVEMTQPTATYMQQYSGKRFLLLATPATIASRIYQNALKGIVELDSVGIAGLAGAIEFDEGKEKITQYIEQALNPKVGQQYEGVILACTHYPLALPLIAPIITCTLGTTTIIDPGLPVAKEAAEKFGEHKSGVLTFLISAESKIFRDRVAALFSGERYTIEVI